MKPSKPRVVTYDARAFAATPSVGSYIRSPNGRRWSMVSNVVLLKQSGKGTKAYRLTLAPTPMAEVPTDATIVKQRQHWRQARVRTEPVPEPVKRRTPQQIRQDRINALAAATLRVKDLLRDDRATGRAIPKVRTETIIDPETGEILRTATAELTEWLDPDDNNPNRRQARKVNGYRTADVIRTLYERGSLVTLQHVRAANRLRKDYELAQGARPGYERPEITDRSFGPASGPQEMQLKALRAYTEAIDMLGWEMSEIIFHVVIRNQFVRAYAQQRGQPEMIMMDILIAGLKRLADHYDPPKQRHTIRTDT